VSRHRLGGARAKLAAANEKLATCSGRISQSFKDFLSRAVGHPDLPVGKLADTWTTLLVELERVRMLRPHLDTVSRVAAQIAESGAPNWAHSIRTLPVESNEDTWTPNEWRDAWTWAQADSYLRAIDGRARLRELDDLRRAADDEVRRLFHNVVRLRTLLMLKARITRSVDSALQMFLTAIRKIGKAPERARHDSGATRVKQWNCPMLPCRAGLCPHGESLKVFRRRWLPSIS
jgi:hypothetical protein